MRGMALLLVAVATAGCVQSVFREPPSSTIGFACAAMDPAIADQLQLELWTSPGLFQFVPGGVTRALGAATGRESPGVTVVHRSGPEVPDGGWNHTNAADWARQDYVRGRVVTLRVLWVPTLPAQNATGLLAGPGVVVVSHQGVAAAAARLGRSEPEVARAVLLHQAGHALGLVNRGTPVSQSDIQEREGAPGHARDPTSVLHAGWDDARTALWESGSYDRYTPAELADLAAARAPGGVCA